MERRQPVVAIDGPAGSGKSTVAQQAARQAGLQFISSGAMYRAVAYCSLLQGVAATDAPVVIALAETLHFDFTTDDRGNMHTLVNGEDITDALQAPEVGALASRIATIPELRVLLVTRQQAYGVQGGIIMEGRDIQTVVFPEADIKIFLTASEEERARRRWKELTAGGKDTSYQDVLADVRMRDLRDAEREVSPLRPAPDAICLDTDRLSISEVVSAITRLIDAWRAHPGLRGADLAASAGVAGG